MIAIDFDGVLAKYNGWNEEKMGEPIEGMKEVVDIIVNELGVESIAIFTTRDPDAVKIWLGKYDFPEVEVTNIKSPRFHVVLDDRAICFEPEMVQSPKELAKRLMTFNPFWEFVARADAWNWKKKNEDRINE